LLLPLTAAGLGISSRGLPLEHITIRDFRDSHVMMNFRPRHIPDSSRTHETIFAYVVTAAEIGAIMGPSVNKR
jgi:hypothetical protein